MGSSATLRRRATLALALALLAAGCLGVPDPAPAPTTPAPTGPTGATPPTSPPDGESGYFAVRPGPAAAGVPVVGHLDADERFDVYVAGPSGGRLFMGSPGGAFRDATEARGVGCACALRHAAIADVDGDERNDLVLLAEDGVRLHLNAGPNASWPESASARGLALARGHALAFADVENDGDLDLAVAEAGGAMRLYLNDGAGFFVEAPAAALADAGGRAFTFAYVDDDAFLDLVVAGSSGLRAFRNLNGTFTETTRNASFPEGLDASALVAADYDNNQALDLVATSPEGLHLLRNTRIRGGFGDRTAAAGFPERAYATALVADFDNNGWLDILAAPASGGLELYRNSGVRADESRLNEAGAFAPVGLGLPPLGRIVALAGGDFDRDGRFDVLAFGADGSATTLLNREEGGRYFTLRLSGNESAFTGVGTKVSLSNGTAFLYRQAGGGASPASAMPVDPFFGLGTDLVEKYTLAIKWPSGILQFESLERARTADRQLVARESASEAPWAEC